MLCLALVGSPRHSFALFSFLRGPQQAGALSAMRLIDEPVTVGNSRPSRKAFLKRWFSAESTSYLKRSALNYLTDCGLPEDLPALKSELDRGDYQTRSAAAEAIVRISLRQGRDQAVKALFD